jgi:hypothetical protein
MILLQLFSLFYIGIPLLYIFGLVGAWFFETPPSTQEAGEAEPDGLPPMKASPDFEIDDDFGFET